MITVSRLREVVEACDNLIKSPNITKKGKINVRKRRKEALLEIMSYTAKVKK